MLNIRTVFFSLSIFFIWEIEKTISLVAYADPKKKFEAPNLVNNYGMPGSIDTPTAEPFPDGQFSVSTSIFGGTIRSNISFQISENITTTFRYSRIPSLYGDHRGYYWDRSFDVHYLVRGETKRIPSIAIGLRDFIGTGLFSSEYLVASKSFKNKIKVSAGVGWGRLAGKNSFSNIFGLSNKRADVSQELGGTFHINQFFSGKNSPFFSINYKLNEKIDLLTEFSSDPYAHETSSPKGLVRKTDLNFGLKYKIAPDVSIMGTLMHGNSVGLVGVLALNPKNAPNKSGFEPAPMPILDRKLLTNIQKTMSDDFFERNEKLLELDGITLLRLEIIGQKVTIDIVDRNYHNVAQMIGRVARILSKTIPPGIEVFKINLIDYYTGFYISEVEIDRQNLEKNELLFDGPEELWKSIKVNNVPNKYPNKWRKDFSPLTWSVYPDVDIMLFDPHAPIRWSIGWKAKARYRFFDSTTLSGSLKQPLIGTMDDVKRGPKRGLPNVRSDFMHYHRDIGTNIFIENLTYDQFVKPFENIYGQINVGYLEMMYAGFRSEIIWKDSSKPYGLGLDVAKVRKRSTNGNFGLKPESYSTYLATLYFDLPNKWNVKMDAGKYLAGDYGSTLSIARSFNNGWEIGAYATLTDVKFSTFGEGSFDKGITLKAPLSWFTGKESQGWRNTVIRPILGDGGAKLELEDEKYLFEKLKAYHKNSFQNNWKRIYR